MVDTVTLPDGTVITDNTDPVTGIRAGGHVKFWIKGLSAFTSWLATGESHKNAAATSASSAASSASIAATSANQSINAKTQAETARDQAVAGLGAADQSTNLAQLAYGIARALAQAAQALRNHDRVLTYHTQSGTATVTQSASSAHFRNYASVAVTLPKPFLTTDYQVVVEAEAAAPFLGAEGQIIVSARATNGFVLLITGSATSATLRWKVIHPNAK